MNLTMALIVLTSGFLIFPYVRGNLPLVLDKEGRRIDIKVVSDVTRIVMQVGVSALILICALYIVLSQTYATQDKHWAYGVLGTILGYWFKPK
jgi:hypothetical protein